jgi:hypothetical protein
VVRGGVEPPTFRFSGLRITVQDRPQRSVWLLSDLRYTPMDAGVRGCMKLGMRLFGRRGSPNKPWLLRARVMAAANCLCLPGPAELDEWCGVGQVSFTH